MINDVHDRKNNQAALQVTMISQIVDPSKEQ